jgi:hypothetical protein
VGANVDFARIDSIKWILAKSKLKVKKLMLKAFMQSV